MGLQIAFLISWTADPPAPGVVNRMPSSVTGEVPLTVLSDQPLAEAVGWVARLGLVAGGRSWAVGSSRFLIAGKTQLASDLGTGLPEQALVG